jgi:hypothetical protein
MNKTQNESGEYIISKDNCNAICDILAEAARLTAMFIETAQQLRMVHKQLPAHESTIH